MKLAVSNIAWPPPHRDEAYALMRDAGVTGLEIAPGLLLADAADPLTPTPAEIAAALRPVDRAGLQLVSMQSLLFGTADAALFQGEARRATLCHAVERAIGLAALLGIPNLVFGSPRQRAYPDNMPADTAQGIAIEVFRKLGDRASAVNTRIAIEPNGRAYGTNFLNSLEQAEEFVRHVAHPSIVLNFDIGALHMEGDFPRIEAIAAHAIDRIGHVHLSEPGLAPAPASSIDAARALRALIDAGYEGWYSIEMAAKPEPINVLDACLERLHAAISAVRSGSPIA